MIITFTFFIVLNFINHHVLRDMQLFNSNYRLVQMLFSLSKAHKGNGWHSNSEAHSLI